MKRVAITWLVAFGFVLAGAVQTALRENAGAQTSVATALIRK